MVKACPRGAYRKLVEDEITYLESAKRGQRAPGVYMLTSTDSSLIVLNDFPATAARNLLVSLGMI